MKIYLSICTLALIIISGAGIANASDWKHITSDESIKYYYDTSSLIKVSNNLFLVSVKEEYRDKKLDGFKEVILLQEINCYHFSYRNKSITTYYNDTNKHSFTVIFGDVGWYYVDYDTIQFDIVLQICNDAEFLKHYLKNKTDMQIK